MCVLANRTTVVTNYVHISSREQSNLYQNVEDVKTFNSEVHEYEYYPYESYGKEVSDTKQFIFHI